MPVRRALIASTLVAASILAAAAPAHAAKTCAEPAPNEWERATPEEAGMDAAKLQAALDYGSQQGGMAVRVYRHGCLVGEDRFAGANRNQKFESWSSAKSVTSMMFGRAMTLGLISPEDPVGSLVPEADLAHGEIAMEDLLTMTSGLRWNGARDYNIFTNRKDRVRDALSLDVVRRPGTYYEYAQSAVSLLAEAIGRSVGDDAGDFIQRELLSPIGIEAGTWFWERDDAGHVMGFYGVNMRPDDYGRLGDLMRRRGVWKGERLLSAEYIERATSPSRTNGCYGWLIWVNDAAPCIGPTISSRPVDDSRDFPDLPADLYRFSGLFGQIVAVFPSQDIVIVRLGQDASLAFQAGEGWQHGLFRRVLDSITDQEIPETGEPERVNDERPNSDYGFQTSFTETDEWVTAGDHEIPPAGPARARAPQLAIRRRAHRSGVVWVRVACPPRWPGELSRCRGVARLEGARRGVRYSIRAGEARTLRFRLTRRKHRILRRARSQELTAVAINRDMAGGTRAGVDRRVLRGRPR